MVDFTARVPYRDRTTGLMLVGILEICLALFFLIGLVFMAIAVPGLDAEVLPAG